MSDFEKNRAILETKNESKKKNGGSPVLNKAKSGHIEGVPQTQIHNLQEKFDPQLRKDFMSVAIGVMQRGRYGETKPRYNTKQLKKLAAIIDGLT